KTLLQRKRSFWRHRSPLLSSTRNRSRWLPREAARDLGSALRARSPIMNEALLITVAIAVGVALIIIFGASLMVKAFYIKVAPDDIKKVAARIGCARASHRETLFELFAAKFSEALKTVGYQMNFVDLYTERRHFRDRIIEQIGTNLDGYHLNDVAIDFLEQTPM